MFGKFRFLVLTITVVFGYKLEGVNCCLREMDVKDNENVDVCELNKGVGLPAHHEDEEVDVKLSEDVQMMDVSNGSPAAEHVLEECEKQLTSAVSEQKHEPSACCEDTEHRHGVTMETEEVPTEVVPKREKPSDTQSVESAKDMAKEENEDSDNSDSLEKGEMGLNFPKTLEEFGYYFNEAGELRSTDGNEPFNFVARQDDSYYNQRRYEALGEVITEYIYRLLEEKAGLTKCKIPVNAENDEPVGFFFVSPEVWTKETIMLLIHGSGVVRAGQWTRKLIINNDLEKGTQLPYIEFAKQQGYGVVVLNTNQNSDDQGRRIRGSETPEDHALYVWDNYIKSLAAKHIAVVAHSYGGVVTSTLLDKRPEFRDRVFAIAFTDSVHGYGLSKHTKKLFSEIAINWVSSSEPLDTPMYNYGDSKRMSAGHHLHEWTSYAAKDSVFKFIEEMYKNRLSLEEHPQTLEMKP